MDCLLDLWLSELFLVISESTRNSSTIYCHFWIVGVMDVVCRACLWCRVKLENFLFILPGLSTIHILKYLFLMKFALSLFTCGSYIYICLNDSLVLYFHKLHVCFFRGLWRSSQLFKMKARKALQQQNKQNAFTVNRNCQTGNSLLMLLPCCTHCGLSCQFLCQSDMVKYHNTSEHWLPVYTICTDIKCLTCRNKSVQR